MKKEPSELSSLIYNYLQEALSEQDKSALEAWLADNSGNRQLFETITNTDNIRKGIINQYLINDTSSEVLNNVLAKIESRNFNKTIIRPTHRIHFLKSTWFKYAAAIILMLGVGSYLWFNHTISIPANRKNPINPSSDITAGTNKATLTLADGSTIILENKDNGKTVTELSRNRPRPVPTEGYNIITIPKGGQYQIVLPDGTKVWLNAASSIIYPTTFTGKDRTVTITGEAYFEVMKNEAMPFKVNVNKQQTIEVLGTSFNINAYNDEGSIKTTLLEGIVRVKSEVVKKQSAVVLKPGEQATISNQQLVISNNINVDQVIAWKNGLFNLQDLSLQEVTRQLERWYDIKVKYEGRLPSINFRGKLSRGEQLSTVLHWFSELGIRNRLEGRTLILSAG